MILSKKFFENSYINHITGEFSYNLACELFPICRSLTGPGVRETLSHIKKHLPDLKTHEIPSGTHVFDWTVPNEWIIRDAYIKDKSGHKIVDFNVNNLHVVGYSEPVDQWINLEELNKHLFSLADQPDAIPYITSYYKRFWGFCLSYEQHKTLKPGSYHVVIDSELKPGVLNYADLVLPGNSKEEVLISTYICHPSMANNELSGIVVTTALARWLMSIKNYQYTYRFVFIPETIGSIVYLNANLDYLKQHVIAGFNVTCIGDDRCFSYLPSRNGNTLSDQVALHVLKHIDPKYKRYTWLDRGSDERQYCAPGIDLPIATIMRSKYGQYPEYHTSLDNLNVITPDGLGGGLKALCQAISIIENNVLLKASVLGEPQLGKRGLYPNISTKDANSQVRTMMNFISYCDGNHSLLDIANIIEVPALDLIDVLKPLVAKDLIKISHQKQ